MSMTFGDFKRAMVVMDGRRLVARARYLPVIRMWQLKGFGMEWTDPRAREPDPGFSDGKAHPQFMLIKRKPEARRILRDLARA